MSNTVPKVFQIALRGLAHQALKMCCAPLHNGSRAIIVEYHKYGYGGNAGIVCPISMDNLKLFVLVDDVVAWMRGQTMATETSSPTVFSELYTNSAAGNKYTLNYILVAVLFPPDGRSNGVEVDSWKRRLQLAS